MKSLVPICAYLISSALPPATQGADRAPAPAVQVTKATGKPKASKKTATTKKSQFRGNKKKSPEAKTVALVQKFYENTKDLSSDFIQTYTRVALSRTSESRGKLTIKKPGMMRWDYRRPVEKNFITDGQRLYVYEPEEEQVIVDRSFKSSSLSTSIAFLWGEGKLSDSFEVKLLDAKKNGAPEGAEVLELVPKKDATYTKLVLFVHGQSGQVMESILHETTGNTNRFKFENTKVNTGVKDTYFKFDPPPNVHVIER